MKCIIKSSLIALIILSGFTNISAQKRWSQEQQDLIKAITYLSQATSKEGGGAAAYGRLLAENFSRWTLGSESVTNKTEWLESIRGWFEEGWYVSDRKMKIVEIRIEGDYAFLRRNVEEDYMGPENESSSSKSALSEIWIKEKKKWKLLMVNVHALNYD
jgi:hypothetical protein